MDDIKSRWELTNQGERREIQREARKEELAGIRSKLFLVSRSKVFAERQNDKLLKQVRRKYIIIKIPKTRSTIMIMMVMMIEKISAISRLLNFLVL